MPPASQSLRLLLVDDDPMVLKALARTLERDGHTVVAAAGGQAGIDAFNASRESGQHFSAVVTDLGMPGVDGLTLASTVKAASPNTPVLLFTGWSQRADESTLPNVDKVLNKPPEPDELRAALAKYCK